MKKPHPLFAALWLARYLVMLAAVILGQMWWLAIAVAVFVPLEFVALLLNWPFRDTLSEIWTWALRSLSKHQVPFVGWNWLAVIFATFEGACVHALLSWNGVVPDGFVDVMAVGLACMLHAHWLRPDIHG